MVHDHGQFRAARRQGTCLTREYGRGPSSDDQYLERRAVASARVLG